MDQDDSDNRSQTQATNIGGENGGGDDESSNDYKPMVKNFFDGSQPDSGFNSVTPYKTPASITENASSQNLEKAKI